MEEFILIPNSLYYGVSKDGFIARLPHQKIHNINKTSFQTKLKILKTSTNNSKGYERITIKYLDETKITESVHRLVAKVYIPNPNNYSQVNHVDGNKTNNNHNNLEWVSNEQNAEHAAKYIRKKFTESKRKNHKLRDEDVIQIAELLKTKTSASIARQFNVSPTTITELKSGRSWRHLKLFQPTARKCEKYFKYKSRYVPTMQETADDMERL